MIKPDTEPSYARRIALYACLAVAAVIVYLAVRPKAAEASMELPSGTVYYKGPLKGKTGQMASDTLNPDIPDTSKPK